MARKLKPADHWDWSAVRGCIIDLRHIRDELKAAGCLRAAAAVRRALKSTEGALRHVDRRIAHTREEEPR